DGSTNGYSTAEAGALTVNSIMSGSLLGPATLSASAGGPSAAVTGRGLVQGVTAAPGASPEVVGQLGYGPDGSEPATGGIWTWVGASYSAQSGASDDYLATLTVPSPGTYDYAYRFAYQAGPWLYVDLDGSANGYSATQAGALTVAAGTIDYGNLQF